MELIEFLNRLAIDSNKLILDEEVEKIICIQEDASIQSPGVPAHYYRFFYFLCQELTPAIIVEFGTHMGISALCFAEGNPQSLVITVNHQDELRPQCIRDNIRYECQDSLDKVSGVDPESVDIMFIDTEHNGIRCLDEFKVHSHLVKPGGLIFFDDIHLNIEMKDFWEKFNPEGYQKFELPIHGWAGMGALIKNDKIA